MGSCREGVRAVLDDGEREGSMVMVVMSHCTTTDTIGVESKKQLRALKHNI